MTPGSTAIMSLILIAIGIGCAILSFLVPDRKKSLISLGLAGLIVVTGLIHFGSGTISRFRHNQRMRGLQRERAADFEAMREQMKQKAGDTTTSGAKQAAPPAKN